MKGQAVIATLVILVAGIFLSFIQWSDNRYNEKLKFQREVRDSLYEAAWEAQEHIEAGGDYEELFLTDITGQPVELKVRQDGQAYTVFLKSVHDGIGYTHKFGRTKEYSSRVGEGLTRGILRGMRRGKD